MMREIKYLITNINPRTSKGGGVVQMDPPPPTDFSDLKMKLSSNQNETFSTCSLIMSTSFDVNWMTSSLILFAYLIMQMKVQIRKL